MGLGADAGSAKNRLIPVLFHRRVCIQKESLLS